MTIYIILSICLKHIYVPSLQIEALHKLLTTIMARLWYQLQNDSMQKKTQTILHSVILIKHWNYITFNTSLDASLQKRLLLFYSKAKDKLTNRKVSLILNKVKFIIVFASR